MNDQNNLSAKLYGTGWKFPPEFAVPEAENDSCLKMSAGTENVAQSLSLIFQTQPGERIMLPSWGGGLQSAMFGNIAEGTLSALQSQIAESVARYEPRAEDVVVNVQEDSTQHSTVNIVVTYRLSGQTRQVSGRLNLFDTSGAAWAM
ncbi:GPW/gp25 family protein (plasmid) [Enterobacter bugandensis]|uniref:GPW/gp25 family protein n=1 Tax=Enterobacter bugandensis TaxID=881260 RepID=UPI00283AA18D|nr:GPW/gp25 family protein [Enterobacter bugandensis]WMU75406.1 GPW/gp25 family protein [Enterobacter bugandensis]